MEAWKLWGSYGEGSFACNIVFGSIHSNHCLRWVYRSQTCLSIKILHFFSDYPGVHIKFLIFSHTHWYWVSWKLYGCESSQVITHSFGFSEQFTEYSCSEWEPWRKGNGMVTHSTIPVTVPTGILHSETIMIHLKSLPHLLSPLNNASRKSWNKSWFKFLLTIKDLSEV